MTSPSTHEPSTPGLPRWAVIYILLLVVVLVYFPLIRLHGYRSWVILTFYIVAGVGSLGGIVAHRMGGQGSS
jgi:hypothetical protein